MRTLLATTYSDVSVIFVPRGTNIYTLAFLFDIQLIDRIVFKAPQPLELFPKISKPSAFVVEKNRNLARSVTYNNWLARVMIDDVCRPSCTDCDFLIFAPPSITKQVYIRSID